MFSAPNVVPIRDIPDPRSATRCGNMWMLAASVVRETLLGEEHRGSTGDLFVLTMNLEGDIEAVPPSHPHYEKRLTSPDFVCLLSRATPTERIAARLFTCASQGPRSS